jgi:hypothetical protein
MGGLGRLNPSLLIIIVDGITDSVAYQDNLPNHPNPPNLPISATDGS